MTNRATKLKEDVKTIQDLGFHHDELSGMWRKVWKVLDRFQGKNELGKLVDLEDVGCRLVIYVERMDRAWGARVSLVAEEGDLLEHDGVFHVLDEDPVQAITRAIDSVAHGVCHLINLVEPALSQETPESGDCLRDHVEWLFRTGFRQQDPKRSGRMINLWKRESSKSLSCACKDIDPKFLRENITESSTRFFREASLETSIWREDSGWSCKVDGRAIPIGSKEKMLLKCSSRGKGGHWKENPKAALGSALEALKSVLEEVEDLLGKTKGEIQGR